MRVLVTLKSDVLTPEDGDYGSQGYPWKIKGQDPTPTPWSGGVATAFASGTGTETDPYMIETAEQLAWLASSTNSGTTYEGKYIALGADIDLGGVQAADGTWSGPQWTPIGNPSNTFAFQGNFNGNGYNISNIYINKSDTDYQGLFGRLGLNGGVIENVRIESGYIYGNNYVAAVCAYAATNSVGVIKNLNKATVIGNTYVGGIVGHSQVVPLYDSVNYGDISGQQYVGGICGILWWSEDKGMMWLIKDCVNYGNVGTGGDIYGGLQGNSGGSD